MQNVLKPGTNMNVSNKDYHGDKSYLSSSSFKLARKDIKAFHEQYILGKRESIESPQMDLGSYVHSGLLEPEKTEEEFAIFPGMVRRGADWELFKKSLNGKIPLTSKQKEAGDTLIALTRANPTAMKYIENALPEYTYCTVLNGFNVKVRADALGEVEPFISDIKTTGSNLDDEALQSTIAKYDYDLSAALYVDAFEEKFGFKPPFYWIFIGTFNKGVVVKKASEKMINNGRRKYLKGMKKIRAAETSGLWDDLKIDPTLLVAEIDPIGYDIEGE